MTDDLSLRDVVPDDLPFFFRQQSIPETDEAAAFEVKNPGDCDAFAAHWLRIQADPSIIIKTIVFRGDVAGSIMSYEESGRAEVSYWLGTQYWGQGIATRALRDFLANVNTTRPIYARAAADNVASLRVLQKCGFAMNGLHRDLSSLRDEEIEEIILVLGASEEG
jgi:RimJ/RimL family protein N-acetyltransferase